MPDGNYKDSRQRIKKQAQRYRIYAFNAAGQVIQEIISSEAKIEWSMHVANTKAAWYGFSNPLDNGEQAPGLPGQRRNQSVIGTKQRAEQLVINSGLKSISGESINPHGNDPKLELSGKFWSQINVKLGHLRTDTAGRLVVFPGDGISSSAIPNNPIANFSDNDA